MFAFRFRNSALVRLKTRPPCCHLHSKTVVSSIDRIIARTATLAHTTVKRRRSTIPEALASVEDRRPASDNGPLVSKQRRSSLGFENSALIPAIAVSEDVAKDRSTEMSHSVSEAAQLEKFFADYLSQHLSPSSRPVAQKPHHSVSMQKSVHPLGTPTQQVFDTARLGRLTEELTLRLIHDSRKTSRARMFQRTLKNYVHVCAYLQQPALALQTLRYYLEKNQRNPAWHSMNDISIFNTFVAETATLSGAASFHEVKLLWNDFEKCGAVSNAETILVVLKFLDRRSGSFRHRSDARERDSFEFLRRRIQSSVPGISLSSLEPDRRRRNLFELLQRVIPSAEKRQEEYAAISQIRKPIESKQTVSDLVRSATPDKHQRGFQTQLSNELKGIVEVTSIIPAKNSRNDEYFSTTSRKWRVLLSDAFAAKIQHLSWANEEQKHNSKSYGCMSILPFLNALPHEDYVDILHTMSLKLTRLLRPDAGDSALAFKLELGRAVFKRFEKAIRIQRGITDWAKEVNSSMTSIVLNNSDKLPKAEQIRRLISALRPQNSAIGNEIPAWSRSVLWQVGEILLDIIAKNFLLPDKHGKWVPVFYISYSYAAKGRGRVHFNLRKLPREVLDRLQPNRLGFGVDRLPMLCAPMPWTSWSEGQYLIFPKTIVSLDYDDELTRDNLASAKTAQLSSTLDALNALSAVPWKINQSILDTALEIFPHCVDDKKAASGKASAETIEQINELNILNLHKSSKAKKKQKDQQVELRKRIAIAKELGDPYSTWCPSLHRFSLQSSLEFKLSLAAHYRNDLIWFPFELDFRGRAYPSSPYLNFTGDDLSKALLLFGEGKPLGSRGLDWLKIYCANLTGKMRRTTLAERLAFADSHLAEILDSAEKPLDGKCWWMSSEEPWQTLAVCFEIRNALAFSNPEAYVCHFPVHQDGTCNGMQHYAALGRDEEAARLMNLAANERPQDLYHVIAEKVEVKRASDAESGSDLAKLLEGMIDRTLVKRTLMTVPYGVTQYGSRSQFIACLNSLDSLPKTLNVYQAARYLSKLTFASLASEFKCSLKIRDWLTNGIADIVCKHFGRPIRWTSPLALPIIQPYAVYKSGKDNADTKGRAERKLVPVVQKQKNAFAANFIHSLDAAHMMLTALECQRASVTFAAIHDCFLSHPATVDDMNRILRQQFVALHSKPLLANLASEIRELCFESDSIVDASNGLCSSGAAADKRNSRTAFNSQESLWGLLQKTPVP